MIHLAAQYFLNHKLEDAELRRHVELLAHAGYECIYAHSRQGLLTPYFADGWWHAIGVMLEECRRHQIKLAIWDEDTYPSPVAGGRILEDHPEYTAQHLEFTVLDAAAAKEIDHSCKRAGKIIRAFAVHEDGRIADITGACGTRRAIPDAREIIHSAYSTQTKIGSPHWRARYSARQWALVWTPAEACRIVIVQLSREHGRHELDLLNADAVKAFLDSTHEEYFRRFGNDFGKLIPSVFFDEPAPDGEFPWTGVFAAEFQKEHGYDLMSRLPHLVLDISGESFQVRLHYRATQHRLQCGNYLQQVQSWCSAHHIQSIGHLSRTEYLSYCNGVLWPDELACCRYIDIPCTDPLGAHAAWRDTASYHTGLKVVSSAAHLFGKEQAGSDALAVTGDSTSLADMAFQLDYQMVLGITYFNIHGLFYSTDGARKDEAPPSLFYHHSEWELMSTVLERTQKLCRKLSQGKHFCEIAVLYPVTDFVTQPKNGEIPLEASIHLLCDDLLSHQKDFDFIDEKTLAEFSPAELGARYQYLVLPEVRSLTGEAAAALEAFPGKVLAVSDRAPQLVGGGSWRRFAEFEHGNVIAALPGPTVEGEGARDIFIQRRTGPETVFLFNRSEREFTGSYEKQAIQLPPRGGRLLEEALMPVPENRRTLLPRVEWQISFDPNHIGLNDCVILQPTGAQEHFDLLLGDQLPETADKGECRFRFLYSGRPHFLELVLDGDTFAGPWRCWVNDREVKRFHRTMRYDNCNLAAEITGLLRTGSTPAVNVIRFEYEGAGNRLREMPRLYGDFRCEMRYDVRSLPHLTGAERFEVTSDLAPWSVLGYGTYSGKAVYHGILEVPEAGIYRLDFGRVEDAVRVRLDDGTPTVLFRPPYRIDRIDLAAGSHTLVAEVFNHPGNRNRLAGHLSGWIGPFRLECFPSGNGM